LTHPTFHPCGFHDLRTGAVSYGYRCYGESGSGYEACWPDVPADDAQFLRRVLATEDEQIRSVLDEVPGNGLYISDRWYEWDAIADLFP
jgi:hypothetical protein